MEKAESAAWPRVVVIVTQNTERAHMEDERRGPHNVISILQESDRRSWGSHGKTLGIPHRQVEAIYPKTPTKQCRTGFKTPDLMISLSNIQAKVIMAELTLDGCLVYVDVGFRAILKE